MKLNRKLVLVLALVLSVAMATSGTLAYLTDRDSATNVLTFGNVDIELTEDFEQGTELIPGVDVEKAPAIKNSGANDAWVWMTVAVPSALNNYIEVNTSNSSDWVAIDNAESALDGYVVRVLKYNNILKSGATTSTAFEKVTLNEWIDIAPDGEMYQVQNGQTTKVGWNVNTQNRPTIYVTAYAIQNDTFNTFDEAYKAYTQQWGEGLGQEGEAVTVISNKAELMALAGTTISGNYELSADIDLGGDEFKAINVAGGTKLVFNGNGHTISNVEFVTSAYAGMNNISMFDLGDNGKPELVVTDLTIKNAKIEDGVNEHTYGAAVVVGFANENSKVTLNNVDVENANIKNQYGNASLMIGYSVQNTVSISNSEVSGTATCEYKNGVERDMKAAFIGTANGCTVTLTDCVNDSNLPDIGRNYNNSATVNGTATKAVTVSGQEAFRAAVDNAEKTALTLTAGNYTMPNGSNVSLQGKSLTIKGDKNTVIDVSNIDERDQFVTGATLKFEGVTLNFGTELYMGFANTESLIYKDCVINGVQHLYGNSITFDGCTLNVSGDHYMVRTWGGKNVTFNNCTFNCDGKALLVYNQSCNLTVNNCTFNDNGDDTISGKAAIEACNGDNGDNCVTHNIVVNNTQVIGFAINPNGTNTGTTLWGNKNSLDDAHLNVTVDGVVVY